MKSYASHPESDAVPQGGVNNNSFLQDRLSTLFPTASSKEFTNIVT